MSNHCDDVGCTVCGRIWCTRCCDRKEAKPTPGGAQNNLRIQLAIKRGRLMNALTICCGKPAIYV